MKVTQTKKSSKKLNAIYGITAVIFVTAFLIFVFNSHEAPENNTSEKIEKTNTMNNTSDNNLKEKLDARKEAFAEKADANTKKVYGEGIADIENSDILSNAKQLGEIAPNFNLVNALGKTISLKNYLKQGPVVLTWYRGGWCPYCNLTLQALQNELPNFQAAGANLIALTPELPDKSLSTKEKHDLKFEVLSDINSEVAKEYGLVFKLTDDVATIYNSKFDLEAYNGNQTNELPLAATYIINQQGEIAYAFIDADYRNRAEPSEITAKLLELKK